MQRDIWEMFVIFYFRFCNSDIYTEALSWAVVAVAVGQLRLSINKTIPSILLFLLSDILRTRHIVFFSKKVRKGFERDLADVSKYGDYTEDFY